MSISRWLTWTPLGAAEIIDQTLEPEPPKPPKTSFEGFDGFTSGRSPVVRADSGLVRADSPLEIISSPERRERAVSCYPHGEKAPCWKRADGSWVCGQCHPDPSAVIGQETDESGPPAIPEGVTMLTWKPERPPVVIKTLAVVNDVPLFIRSTLEQLRASIAGENWLAGNRSVRELLDRLEQVGVKVEVATR